MERVQFQQEQMLAELKDLVEKGLFTEAEIKQIMKKRTTFETSLIRRVAKKGDFLRYASYEVGLEALRRKRAERISASMLCPELQPGPPTVSDYALVRRQFHIFERALKKFKSDIGLWVQYIQLAKKEGARSLVGRITARAMKLHPNVPAFYILAASHELEHLSPSAARVLLQRGIRLNADSIEMWREYVKMELGFIEGLRRRWELLGIKVYVKGKAKETNVFDDAAKGGERDVGEMEVDVIEEDGAETARREIMQGAIVKTVVANAVKALPKAELFAAIHDLLSNYPSPQPLRTSLLDYLHSLLQATLPGDPHAIKLTATRFLASDLDTNSSDFVDVLQTASEKLAGGVKDAWAVSVGSEGDQERKREGMAQVYAQFIEEWCQKDIDLNLKMYLFASLHGLIRSCTTSKKSQKSCAPLLATHISLAADLSRLPTPPPSLPSRSKILNMARKYTDLQGADVCAKVWLARLEAERLLGDDSDVGVKGRIGEVWKGARAHVQGEGVINVWIWGLQIEDGNGERPKTILAELLNESIRMQDSSSFTDVHEALLDRYCSLSYALITTQPRSDKRLLTFIRRVKNSYLPTAHTWSHLFTLLTSEESDPPLPPLTTSIAEVYHHWRGSDVVDSSVSYARWLLRQGRAKEAMGVIQGVREEEAKEEVTTKWREFLDSQEGQDRVEQEDLNQMDVDL